MEKCTFLPGTRATEAEPNANLVHQSAKTIACVAIDPKLPFERLDSFDQAWEGSGTLMWVGVIEQLSSLLFVLEQKVPIHGESQTIT